MRILASLLLISVVVWAVFYPHTPTTIPFGTASLVPLQSDEVSPPSPVSSEPSKNHRLPSSRVRRSSDHSIVRLAPVNIYQPMADENSSDAFAALYPPLDGSAPKGLFTDSGTLTEDGRAQRCPLAMAELTAWERDEAPQDECGLGHATASTWADAALQRGCMSEVDWVQFYQRSHQRRLAREQAFWRPQSLASGPFSPQCGLLNTWAEADLSERRSCEVLATREGLTYQDASCETHTEEVDSLVMQ